MNIERLLRVKQRVKDSPNFDMRCYFYGDIAKGNSGYYIKSAYKARQSNPCGTSACIAGEAVLLAYEDSLSNLINDDAYLTAKAYLDLTETETEWLFMGEWQDGSLVYVTKEDACKAIDWLVGGGSIEDPEDEDGYLKLDLK